MKKLMLKMMTGFCMLGVIAVLDAPITAYAGKGYLEIISTGEVIEIEFNDDGTLTPEQQAAAEARMANWGDAPVPTPPTGTSNSSSASKSKKSTPTYTQEQIDAAWEEVSRIEATCAVEGQIAYKNTITGDIKQEPIAATGVHTYEETGHKDATCEAEGYDTCSVCGEKVTIPATGHTVGKTEATKKAGLFSTGTKTTYCANCDEVMATAVIPQTCPFSLVQVVAVAIAIVVCIVAVTGFVLKKRSTAKAVA